MAATTPRLDHFGFGHHIHPLIRITSCLFVDHLNGDGGSRTHTALWPDGIAHRSATGYGTSPQYLTLDSNRELPLCGRGALPLRQSGIQPPRRDSNPQPAV